MKIETKYNIGDTVVFNASGESITNNIKAIRIVKDFIYYEIGAFEVPESNILHKYVKDE